MKREEEILSMRPATGDISPRHDCRVVRVSAGIRLRQISSTAKDDWPAEPDTAGSFCLFLFGKATQGFLSFLDIVQCQFSGFHKACHDRFRSSPKKAEQVIDQRILCRVARDRCFENIRVADTLGAA